MIPQHLKKYIVKQEAAQYTPIEQASWRFILRQLKNYLSKNAHSFYIEGLEKTGISVEEIPSIQEISNQLNKFGWQAAPVSGFIPPSAFLELQAHRILPIASDMRSLSHMMYTPAPDIVHEAAGHAPMTAHPEFREYLEMYAQIAKKAIINKEDLDLYSAIRELSDVKEHPNSTKEDIELAQKKLNLAYEKIGEPSEASLLSRMAWWTTEYGLIGNPPKIYGAGLLSSFGESKSALEDKVKKIPLSVDCIEYSYDITEPQPQLFVTPDFEHLKTVLNQLSDKMSYKIGGEFGLSRAKKAQTVTTIELNSGVQVSGVLNNYLKKLDKIIYLQFSGPSQICFRDLELENQSTKRHPHGYSSPIGFLKNYSKCLSEFTKSELEKVNLTINQKVKLEWISGVELEGILIGHISKEKKNLVFTFKNCTVQFEDKVLYQPEWGEFDLVCGESVSSVFGGAADKIMFGDFEDFKALKIPEKKYSEKELLLFDLYQQVRNLRKNLKSNISNELELILNKLKSFPNDWLLKLEILELSKNLNPEPKWVHSLEAELMNEASKNQEMGYFIKEGIKLSQHLKI